MAGCVSVATTRASSRKRCMNDTCRAADAFTTFNATFDPLVLSTPT